VGVDSLNNVVNFLKWKHI